MWTSAASTHEHGAVDWASKALGGLVFQEEEEEEEEAAKPETMDQTADGDGDDDDTPAVNMNMPEPVGILVPSTNGQWVEFPAQRMATSCAVISPQVLNGLYAIDDLTKAHKKAVCMQFALPLLVPASPAVAFCMRKITNDRRRAHNIARVAAVQSWVMSAGSARQLVFHISAGLVAFHASIKPAFVQECDRAFKQRINDYELDVFAPALKAARTLDAFVSALEATSFFYLHACEEYIFRTIIEPHCGATLALAEVLTPRVTYGLDQCANDKARHNARKCVGDFFEFKAVGLAEKYDDVLPRISVPSGGGDSGGHPRGDRLIPEKTLQEYWELCKYIYE